MLHEKLIGIIQVEIRIRRHPPHVEGRFRLEELPCVQFDDPVGAGQQIRMLIPLVAGKAEVVFPLCGGLEHGNNAALAPERIGPARKDFHFLR